MIGIVFSLMCVDDDPIDSYGSPADDGGGEDDGHHDSHTVKAPMMRLKRIPSCGSYLDIDTTPVQPAP